MKVVTNILKWHMIRESFSESNFNKHKIVGLSKKTINLTRNKFDST